MPRRGLDAVGAAAEIDAIEIELEDLVLGEALLEPDRVDHLFELPRHGALGRQEQVLGELLGDGRAALDHGAGGCVAERRAHEPERVDAEMVVEAAVLGRDHRLGEVRRQHVEADMAAAQAPLGEHGAVLGEDGDVGRAIVERGDDGVGHARDEIDDREPDHDRAPDRREQGEADRLVEERVPARRRA